VTFVLDASVTLAWCFDDEQSALSEHTLDLLIEQVPSCRRCGPTRSRTPWPSPSKAHPRRCRSPVPGPAPSTADPHLADELDLPPVVEDARRHGRSAHDVAYLALAAWHGLALATHDSQLAARATTAGVQLLS
jgi:hypothetical protein